MAKHIKDLNTTETALALKSVNLEMEQRIKELNLLEGQRRKLKQHMRKLKGREFGKHFGMNGKQVAKSLAADAGSQKL